MTDLILKYYTLDKDEQKKLNTEYHKWVAVQDSCIGDVPCDYCGRPHHLQFTDNHGTSSKPISLYEIPIPRKIHDDFHKPPHKWHDKANAYVEQKYSVDLVEILIDLHNQFLKERKEEL